MVELKEPLPHRLRGPALVLLFVAAALVVGYLAQRNADDHAARECQRLYGLALSAAIPLAWTKQFCLISSSTIPLLDE